MITLLFIYPTPFNPQIGGVERVTDLLARKFIDCGYRVLYLHHIYIDSLRDYDYPAPLYFFPNSDYKSQENVTFYHNFLRENNVDFIINQCGLFEDSTLYLNIGEHRCKTISVIHFNPMLNYEHLSSEELVLKDSSFKGLLKLVARLIFYPKIKSSYLSERRKQYDFLFRTSDVICFLSKTHLWGLKKYYKNYNQGKVISISNPTSFKPQKCEKKKQLLYVGRLDKGQKRPDRLLKIWRKLYKKFPDWEMVVVGDGKERLRLEKIAKNLERISFVGFQSPETYYRDASIFCMTSNFEGFPMVLSEAMAFGTIPFAFDSFLAVHDIIDDGKTGVLVKPFSIREYAQKLELLMSDEEKIIQMSEKCVQSANRFNIDDIVSKWISLFDSLSNN